MTDHIVHHTDGAVPDNVQDTVVDVVKKKRKRPDLTDMMTPHTEPGEISRMIKQAMTISHWPDIDTNDPDQVADRIDRYHTFCFENDIKPDMSGMALAFGVSRKTLWAWENGVDSNKPQSVRNVLKKGRQINEILLSQMMLNGKINPVTGIFLLKNSHEFRDQQDVVITPNTPYQDGDIKNVDEVVQALPDPDTTE